MRVALVAIQAALWMACSRADTAGGSATSGQGEPVVWSRQAAVMQGGDAAPMPALDGRSPAESAANPYAVASADPAALAEILAAAPRDAGTPTQQDGGSRIATDTGVTEGKGGEPPAVVPPVQASAAPAPAGSEPAGQASRISLGAVQFQQAMSSASVERSARAQLYFGLVQRCRDKEGKILPPDAVKVEFNLDSDGYIVASTIRASTQDPRYEDAAHCVRRELSAATFRAPPATRGMPASVTLTLPSVD
jgi:hypothetical protein